MKPNEDTSLLCIRSEVKWYVVGYRVLIRRDAQTGSGEAVCNVVASWHNFDNEI